MNRCTVDVLKGWLCIREEAPNYSKPQVDVLFWPVAVYNKFSHEHLLNHAVRSTGNGMYETVDWPAKTLRLYYSGTTRLIARTTIPVKKARARKCEWRYGYWAVYTKKGRHLLTPEWTWDESKKENIELIADNVPSEYIDQVPDHLR